MLLQPLPDERTLRQRTVTELLAFLCERCGCSARLCIAVPDAPAWQPAAVARARRGDRDAPRRAPLAVRRPRQRAHMAARLVRCPSCGHRNAGAVAMHVALSMLRALFGFGLAAAILSAIALADDLGARIVACCVGGLIGFYALRIAMQDRALLRPMPDLHWSNVVGGR
ncbi:MAG TPA: hypothetical protein VG755_29845 [Nannocystaceae bacterium]|nr:hypothetical protein [Nannocystaceae bacterium]